MAKPDYRWQTPRHTAYRVPDLPAAWQKKPRAEAFELHFTDGRRGRAVLALDRQEVDAVAAEDPELVTAVQAWLVARGQRQIELECAGSPLERRMLARGPIDVAALGTAPLRPPQRLVTLCPSNAELVNALGVFDRVVACESSSDFPHRVASLPRLGPDLAPDLEELTRHAPDLVISSLTVPGMERNVMGLRMRGTPQWVSAPRDLDDVLGECSALGAALGVPKRAARVVQALEAQRRSLVARLPAQRARVYLEWWPKPMFSPGSNCYSNELIDLAGGENVFAHRSGSSLQIDAEDLRRADPDVCFVSWCGVPRSKLDPQRLCSRPGLSTLRAVREGRVYPLDERFSGRPGPRMLQACRVMARAIRQALC